MDTEAERLDVRKRHQEKEDYRIAMINELKTGDKSPAELQKENGWFSLPDAVMVRCSSNFLTG